MLLKPIIPKAFRIPKMNNDQQLIAEAYIRIYHESDREFRDEDMRAKAIEHEDLEQARKEITHSPKLAPGAELIYNKPFKLTNGEDVYYVVDIDKDEDDVTRWHTLINRHGSPVCHIELTSRETLSREDVQNFINAKMPTAYNIHKSNGSGRGGAFTIAELHTFLKGISSEDDEVMNGDGSEEEEDNAATQPGVV